MNRTYIFLKTFLKDKSKKYKSLNELPVEIGRGGIDASQAINFINAIVVAQLLWGSMYILIQLKPIRVFWKILLFYHIKLLLVYPEIHQIKCPGLFLTRFRKRVTMKSDYFIYKAVQFCKGRIINKITNLIDILYKKHVASRNVPFLISRRPQVESFLKHLYKWNIYPYFLFLFKIEFNRIECDFRSGTCARDSGNPNFYFFLLISTKKLDLNEIDIFTDESESTNEKGISTVGYSVVIPQFSET